MGGEADICLTTASFHVNGTKYYLQYPIGLRRESIPSLQVSIDDEVGTGFVSGIMLLRNVLFGIMTWGKIA